MLLSLTGCAGDPVRGKQVVLARGDGSCLLCHAVPGADRPSGNVGPSLAGVGARASVAEMRLRIVDPTKFNAESVMPPYGRAAGLYAVAPQYRSKPLLSEREIDDAVAFLLTLK